DFGGAEASQKVTRTGMVMGTPEFMSPEQLSGDNLDGRSDLYSLALVLFQMLSGTLPFEATTVQETMIKRLTEQPAKLNDVRPDLSFPPGLQAVFDTALARKSAERYQSVAKFAADVAAVAGRPVARSVPPTEAKTVLLDLNAAATQRIPVKRRSFMPIAAAAVLVLGVGGAWVVLNGAGSNRAAEHRSDSAAVSHDTAKQQGTPQTVAVRPRPAARFNVAGAASALNELIDSIDVYSNKMIRDSASALFYNAGVTPKDSALAAFVIGNTYFQMKDLNHGCDWMRRAAAIDPGSNVYSRFIQDQCN
ncbi:MAG TPA: hypothetical protein VKD28_00820, partial [Gemmatimonadales bacterium]|nr:hypothetical protein [Gemmatimonadales bacterium]